VSQKNLYNWIHSERRTLFFLDDQYHLHNYGYTDTRTLVHYLLGPRVLLLPFAMLHVTLNRLKDNDGRATFRLCRCCKSSSLHVCPCSAGLGTLSRLLEGTWSENERTCLENSCICWDDEMNTMCMVKSLLVVGGDKTYFGGFVSDLQVGRHSTTQSWLGSTK
jgi:hypothetical protein